MQPTMNPARTTYWRWYRLAALFSLFSIFAITHGDHARRSRLLDVLDVSDVLAPFSCKAEGTTMIFFTDWLPPAVVGVTFTLLGALKLYGFARGVVGGADKPFITKLCGT